MSRNLSDPIGVVNKRENALEKSRKDDMEACDRSP
jgi:hypothetical protein